MPHPRFHPGGPPLPHSPEAVDPQESHLLVDPGLDAGPNGPLRESPQLGVVGHGAGKVPVGAVHDLVGGTVHHPDQGLRVPGAQGR